MQARRAIRHVNRAWASSCILLAIALAIVAFPLLAAYAGPKSPASVPGRSPSAAQAGQPALTIVSPIDGGEFSKSDLEVKIVVRVPEGSSLVSVRVLIDGRLAARDRGLFLLSSPTTAPAQQATHILTVPVPPQNCVLSVLAETVPTSSPAASVRLRWKSTSSTLERATAAQPRLNVLAIGVSEYQQAELRLLFAAKDARDLTAQLKAQSRILYRSVETKLLTDRQASKANILDGLEWLQRQTTAKDIAVLFMAGHGINDPGTGNYHFLPYDADMAAIKRTMLPESEIRETLAAIPGKVLLFIDSCHSGKVFGGQTRGPNDLSAFITELARAENGVVVFAASTGRQSSQESVAWNNGAFTKALLEGLSGRADVHKTGRVTINMLDLYISERVKQLTSGTQTPTTAKPETIPDFPIAVVREIRDDDVDLVH